MTLRIAFLPLDNRPITRDAFVVLAQAAGAHVATPPRGMLGSRREPADVDALWEWVDGEGREADLLIASAELLIYGGLVPSRIGREPLDRCLARAGRFVEARRRVPHRRILLAASVLRLPALPDASEEPEYWTDHGPDIFAYSFHGDRFAETGDPASQRRAAAAEAAVPRAVLADVLSRRARNLTVLLALVGRAARGELDGLLIGQDDTAEYGLPRRDLRAVEAAIAEQAAAPRAWVTVGTDELAVRLLARTWLEATGGGRTVEVVYAYPAHRDAVPRYEGQGLDRTVTSHITTAGCRRVRGAGLTLFVHNFPGAQEEAPFQEPYDAAVLRPFLDAIAAAAAARRPFAVADVRYSNGADRTFVASLLRVPCVASTAAYGGWNTASNTIGMTLAQGLLPPGPASQAFTIARLLDDWAYQADIRQRLATAVVPRYPGADPRRLGPARAACAEAAGGWMTRDYCPPLTECFGRSITVGRVGFPWDRLFEIDLGLDIAAPGSWPRTDAVYKGQRGLGRRADDVPPGRAAGAGPAEKAEVPMDADARVGQLLTVDFSGYEPGMEIERLIVEGGVGGVILFAKNIENAAQVARLTNGLQRIAESAGRPPLLISIDQEGGPVVRIQEAAFPSAMAFAAAGDGELVSRAADVTARALRAVGVHLNCAPVLDVNSNPANPVIGVRSYGEDPAVVARLGVRAIAAMQAAGVLAAAKHFPGHGDTALDSHLFLPSVPRSRAQLEAVELAPFREAVRCGVGAVMTAHVVYPALDPDRPATLSPAILGELRRGFGFPGLIVSDSMRMRAIADHYEPGPAAVQAVKAGVDIVLALGEGPAQWDALDALHAAVRTGEIPPERLDAAAARVTAAKRRLGLPSGTVVSEDEVGARVGLPEHRALARRVADAAATRVMDCLGVLPLPSGAVLVATGLVHDGTAERLAAALRAAGGSARVASLDAEAESGFQGPVVVPIGELTLADETSLRELPSPERIVDVTGRARRCGPVVAVATAAPYPLRHVAAGCAAVAVYGADDASLQAAARVLDGTIPARGTLPVTVWFDAACHKKAGRDVTFGGPDATKGRHE